MSFLEGLTNFGDLAVLLPVSAAILLWLLRRSPRGVALWWLASLALCGGLTAGLKILFYACPPAADLHSPSGHTALSLLVYGGLAVIAAAPPTPRWQRIILIAAGLALALGIAFSRVALHDHTRLETAIGLAIGGASLALFSWRYLSQPRSPAPVWPLIAVSAAVLVVLHGDQLRAEEFLKTLGAYLHQAVLGCG